ncbi:hypothetical protein Dimus_036672, partial [Dionaea muscipula]
MSFSSPRGEQASSSMATTSPPGEQLRTRASRRSRAAGSRGSRSFAPLAHAAMARRLERTLAATATVREQRHARSTELLYGQVASHGQWSLRRVVKPMPGKVPQAAAAGHRQWRQADITYADCSVLNP